MNTTKSKKRVLSRVVSMALCLVMIVAMFCTVTFSASAENEKVMEARSGVVQIQVWFVDPLDLTAIPLHTGSGFLINDTTVVTCDHVATGFIDEFYNIWAQATNDATGGNRTAEDIKNNLEIRISVYRDVYVRARVHTSSSDMDYAVLYLDEAIQDRTPLKLRSSSTLKQTEDVYALGFPGDINDITSQSTYDADDVAVTSGTVTKVGDTTYSVPIEDPAFGFIGYKEHANLNVVNHSARITGGNSGGPLVDANGAVVGINVAASEERNLAVSSDELIKVLDALGIGYELYGSNGGRNDTETTENTEATEATEATVPPTTKPVETTEPEVEKDKEEDEGFFANTTNIIILAVGAVVLILVVVVVIVVVGGKKKTPAAAAPAQQARPAPAQQARPVSAPPAQPQYAPPAYHQPAQRPIPMGAPAQGAASETTVLNQGAGETTVLAKKVNGGKLIRKSTGEVVEINNEHFVIGRERKNVNYCIANNTNISRSHAKILVKSSGVYLVDMGTANGSFVNGVKAEPRHEIQLKNGDKITLADEDLEYQI